MRDIASIMVGIAVGLAWLVLWEGLVLVPGVPFLKQTAEDRASRREGLKRMGKLKYVLLFGVLGYGFAFALALPIADYSSRNALGLTRGLSKFVFLAIAFGLISGFRHWREFRDPVPFPPNYPHQK